MASGYKRKNISNDFVVSDDEESRPSKKGKATGPKVESSTSVKTDEDGNKYWALSSSRRVTISEFKKNSMVSIREYYEKDGKHLPGKKGISMPIEQYSALVELLPQIEKQLEAKGEAVARPSYDDNATKDDVEQDAVDDDVSEEDVDGETPSNDDD